MNSEQAQEFWQIWQLWLPQIRLHCYRLAGGRDLGEELLSIVQDQTYRSFHTYHGSGSFIRWVGRIIDRAYVRMYSRERRKIPLETIDEPPAPTPASTDASWVQTAIQQALLHKALTLLDATLLKGRLCDDLSFTHLSQDTGEDENKCRLRFHRALPKFCEFVCRHPQYFPEGEGGLTKAFTALLQKHPPILTPSEAEIFQKCVLAKDSTIRTFGKTNDLRQACLKVLGYYLHTNFNP